MFERDCVSALMAMRRYVCVLSDRNSSAQNLLYLMQSRCWQGCSSLYSGL